MSKEEFVKRTLELLSADFASREVVINGEKISVEEYVSRNADKYVTSGFPPEMVVGIINKILKPVTITLEDKINYIENFLENHQLEIKELEVKSGFTINIREELLDCSKVVDTLDDKMLRLHKRVHNPHDMQIETNYTLHIFM